MHTLVKVQDTCHKSSVAVAFPIVEIEGARTKHPISLILHNYTAKLFVIPL
jgi:hypothetical protein